MVNQRTHKKIDTIVRQEAADTINNMDFSPKNNFKQEVKAKIAIVGEKDVVNIFRTIGFEVFPQSDSTLIQETLKDLTDKKYTIIFITEKEAQVVNDFLNTRRAIAYPIIVPIPNGVENLGYGLNRVQENLHKAIGAN